jgi:hypothetical protein
MKRAEGTENWWCNVWELTKAIRAKNADDRNIKNLRQEQEGLYRKIRGQMVGMET